jgi:hypothetical protein
MVDETKDWEIHPDNYLKNEDGSFVLKVDGTPKKKSGRKVGVKSKGYNYHSEQKAKIAARRSVKKTKDKINSLSNIIFKPNEGPQTDFLAAPETDVSVRWCSRRSGKSYAMLVDPLRFAHRAAHRALLLRRSMPELRELN